MLIKEVVRDYKGQVEFVSQNWGTSELAARYGLKRYPVVFVDEVLVVQPKDFGGWGDKNGKYSPWRDPANHEKFKKDISRMIDLLLAGEREAAMKSGEKPDTSAEIASIPKFNVEDIEGRAIDSDKLRGQVVVVEFWATWCPPCLTTLGWLGKLEKQHRDKITVIAVAVESEKEAVRQMARDLKLPVNVVIGSKELVAPFGDFSSVPTMFVFDREGRTASVFYGARKDLHQKAGELIASLSR